MKIVPNQRNFTIIFTTLFSDEPATVTDFGAAGASDLPSVCFADNRWHIQGSDGNITTDSDLFQAIGEYYQERGSDEGWLVEQGFNLAMALNAP